jgi:hypothetical protein
MMKISLIFLLMAFLVSCEIYDMPTPQPQEEPEHNGGTRDKRFASAHYLDTLTSGTLIIYWESWTGDWRDTIYVGNNFKTDSLVHPDLDLYYFVAKSYPYCEKIVKASVGCVTYQSPYITRISLARKQ